jgi:hypothetical protein
MVVLGLPDLIVAAPAQLQAPLAAMTPDPLHIVTVISVHGKMKMNPSPSPSPGTGKISCKSISFLFKVLSNTVTHVGSSDLRKARTSQKGTHLDISYVGHY